MTRSQAQKEKAARQRSINSKKSSKPKSQAKPKQEEIPSSQEPTHTQDLLNLHGSQEIEIMGVSTGWGEENLERIVAFFVGIIGDGLRVILEWLLLKFNGSGVLEEVHKVETSLIVPSSNLEVFGEAETEQTDSLVNAKVAAKEEVKKLKRARKYARKAEAKKAKGEAATKNAEAVIPVQIEVDQQGSDSWKEVPLKQYKKTEKNEDQPEKIEKNSPKKTARKKKEQTSRPSIALSLVAAAADEPKWVDAAVPLGTPWKPVQLQTRLPRDTDVPANAAQTPLAKEDNDDLEDANYSKTTTFKELATEEPVKREIDTLRSESLRLEKTLAHSEAVSAEQNGEAETLKDADVLEIVKVEIQKSEYVSPEESLAPSERSKAEEDEDGEVSEDTEFEEIIEGKITKHRLFTVGDSHTPNEISGTETNIRGEDSEDAEDEEIVRINLSTYTVGDFLATIDTSSLEENEDEKDSMDANVQEIAASAESSGGNQDSEVSSLSTFPQIPYKENWADIDAEERAKDGTYDPYANRSFSNPSIGSTTPSQSSVQMDDNSDPEMPLQPSLVPIKALETSTWTAPVSTEGPILENSRWRMQIS